MIEHIPFRGAVSLYEGDISFLHHLEWKVLPNYTINKDASNKTTFMIVNLNLPDISGNLLLTLEQSMDAQVSNWSGKVKRKHATWTIGPDHFGFKTLHRRQRGAGWKDEAEGRRNMGRGRGRSQTNSRIGNEPPGGDA